MASQRGTQLEKSNVATKWIIAALVCTLVQVATHAEKVVFEKIPSPVIFRGDATTAYRDPAAIYHDGWFHLFFTLVKIEPDKQVYSYCAISKSRDLQNWSEPRIITPRDQNLNFGSPGNVIRFGDEWVLCLQTYPRPNGEKFGNETSRCWIRRSRDLENWSEPELLRLKGPDVPQEKMGRMIDPFLFEDRDDPGKWWCVSKGPTAWSRDLKTWTPFKGHIPRGRENPCMLLDGQDYVLFLSQNHPDGIAVMRSRDLLTWQEEAVLTFGQREWSWAQGRLTAGFVLDLRQDTDVGKALMFFHGSDFPESSPKGGFDNFASLGIAWSSDLKTWEWPGKTAAGLSATVAPHKGRNVFWVDGKPVPPLMYSGTEHSRSTWERRPRQSIEDFARLGYRIIQTDMWFKYSLQPDDGFDWDGVRKQLDGILKAAPDALFVVRINVSAPNWWLKQNPDETCRVTKPLEPDERARFGGNSAESLASERYGHSPRKTCGGSSRGWHSTLNPTASSASTSAAVSTASGTTTASIRNPTHPSRCAARFRHSRAASMVRWTRSTRRGRPRSPRSRKSRCRHTRGAMRQATAISATRKKTAT